MLSRFDPFDGGERVASTRKAATGKPLGWRVEYLLQGEVVPSGELLAASQIAWHWLGWVGAIDGKAGLLPAETFGPLPAM